MFFFQILYSSLMTFSSCSSMMRTRGAACLWSLSCARQGFKYQNRCRPWSWRGSKCARRVARSSARGDARESGDYTHFFGVGCLSPNAIRSWLPRTRMKKHHATILYEPSNRGPHLTEMSVSRVMSENATRAQVFLALRSTRSK